MGPLGRHFQLRRMMVTQKSNVPAKAFVTVKAENANASKITMEWLARELFARMIVQDVAFV